jgi:hypothetical protein
MPPTAHGRSVYRGPDGILEGLHEGTVLPDEHRRAAGVAVARVRRAARGACLLAPVSGST